MKLIHYYEGNQIKMGMETASGIVAAQLIASKDPGFPMTIDALIHSSRQTEYQKVLEKADTSLLPQIPFSQIKHAPCVLNPEKIICVGVNYLAHAAECRNQVSDVPDSPYPVIFSKFANALAANGQEILLPDTAYQYDYEAELVIIIGKEAQNVSEEEALAYVFGYTAGNDISARDLQTRTSQWLLGKTSDGFAPIGPCIVTADALDCANLGIQCEVNGELRQNSNTANMIFSCRSVISYLSKYLTLKPGDIIFTGTPEGVVMGKPDADQHWLEPGDLVTVTIEGIGSLTNRMSR